MTENKKVLSPENIGQAFGTPVSTFLWPDSEAVNADLRQTLLDRETREAGISRSNVGGWHSTPDMLLWDAPGILHLRNRITSMSRDLIGMTSATAVSKKVSLHIDCWGNISRQGNYNSAHNHPDALWSGVYYVSQFASTSDHPTNGKIEFLDPRTGPNMVSSAFAPTVSRFIIDPIPGLMVFFPSWLVHMVHPFTGTGERISVSFNIVVKQDIDS